MVVNNLANGVYGADLTELNRIYADTNKNYNEFNGYLETDLKTKLNNYKSHFKGEGSFVNTLTSIIDSSYASLKNNLPFVKGLLKKLQETNEAIRKNEASITSKGDIGNE